MSLPRWLSGLPLLPRGRPQPRDANWQSVVNETLSARDLEFRRRSVVRGHPSARNAEGTKSQRNRGRNSTCVRLGAREGLTDALFFLLWDYEPQCPLFGELSAFCVQLWLGDSPFPSDPRHARDRTVANATSWPQPIAGENPVAYSLYLTLRRIISSGRVRFVILRTISMKASQYLCLEE
jgi:hypothetical protein